MTAATQAESEPAIILHRRDYRDSSLLLDVFSRDHGRVGLVAKGVKKPRARWRGQLEPLRLLQLGWRGRSDLKTLTQADPVLPALTLRGVALYAGFYAAELVLRMTPREDPNPDVFRALLETLHALGSSPDINIKLRTFELSLLDACGYGLPLHETQAGNAIRADGWYSFDPIAGFSEVDEPAPGRVSGRVILALQTAGAGLAPVRREARELLARALQPHLGARPLQSAITLRAMQKLRRTSTGSEEGGQEPRDRH